MVGNSVYKKALGRHFCLTEGSKFEVLLGEDGDRLGSADLERLPGELGDLGVPAAVAADALPFDLAENSRHVLRRRPARRLSGAARLQDVSELADHPGLLTEVPADLHAILPRHLDRPALLLRRVPLTDRHLSHPGLHRHTSFLEKK